MQHPVEHLDALAGNGQEAPQVTLDSNPAPVQAQTTSLEEVEKAAATNLPTGN